MWDSGFQEMLRAAQIVPERRDSGPPDHHHPSAALHHQRLAL